MRLVALAAVTAVDLLVAGLIVLSDQHAHGTGASLVEASAILLLGGCAAALTARALWFAVTGD